MRLLLVPVLAIGLLAGCGTARPGGVVATTTVWGSIAQQIADCSEAAGVDVLMPVGADAHDYTPSSADVAAMVEAPLVVANGLGLEEGMASAVESATADGATILEVGPHLDPVDFASGTADPHVWLDMSRAAQGARAIGNGWAQATGDSRFGDCGGQVAQEISTTEQELIATLASIPADRRMLVSDHDSLEYFASAYGFTVVGDRGSRRFDGRGAEFREHLQQLTHTIEQTGCPAIFSDRGESRVPDRRRRQPRQAACRSCRSTSRASASRAPAPRRTSP